jgi:cytochrome c peroxidase
MKQTLRIVSTAMGVAMLGCGGAAERKPQTEQQRFALEAAPNEAGVAETLHTSGAIDRTNPFFLAMGTNPRSCETCHSAAQGWTMNAATAVELLKDSDGLDPLFNLVDQGTRPDADVSSYDARVATFKELTAKRGLTRFTRAAPGPAAEFTLIAVADPWGWSDTTRYSGFRRPTPTANESKASTTNWTAAADPLTQVRGTGIGATRLHEQRDPANLLPVELAVAEGDFMFGVIFAQAVDNLAGPLDEDGARGGPAHLMAQPFFLGITAPKVFDIYDAWAAYQGSTDARGAARAAIWRGQEVFNTAGHCGGCHNTPNVGGHNVVRFFNIGTAEPPKCDPVLPLLTVQNKATGETRTVCDLGRAQSTGLWSDIGRFRAPPLRGLVPRAPYFHDGQARSLADVIRHYDERLTLNLSGQQKHDLEAFLRAL